MAVLGIPLMLALAWILGVTGVQAPGAPAGAPWDINTMHWTLFLPVGVAFLVGAFMHSVLAKRTAKMIGWQTNGFQYEIAFVSLGLGIGAMVANWMTGPDPWIIVAIPTTTFLVLAGLNHVREIVRERNYAPGNTLILISDFGTPITLWVLLAATGSL